MCDNNPLTFVNLRRLPARVDYQGAAYLLNFEVVAIRALVELGFLKWPRTKKWLHCASRAVAKYWAKKMDGANPAGLPCLQDIALRPRMKLHHCAFEGASFAVTHITHFIIL